MSITSLPTYIENSIREPQPSDGCVVPGSTLVVAFGSARQAMVATLGLNPSRVEFLDRRSCELPEHRRRLETHRSLGVSDLHDAPRCAIECVLAGCDVNFHRNPYWQ